MDEMTVIEEIVGHENEQEEEDEQDHGNRLVRLRPLHNADIRFKSVISRLLLIQLRIYLIVILIQLPVVQRQSSHGNLIAKEDNHVVIGREMTVEPIDLGRFRGIQL